MVRDTVKESTTLTLDRGILSDNLISVADRIWFSRRKRSSAGGDWAGGSLEMGREPGEPAAKIGLKLEGS